MKNPKIGELKVGTKFHEKDVYDPDDTQIYVVEQVLKDGLVVARNLVGVGTAFVPEEEVVLT